MTCRAPECSALTRLDKCLKDGKSLIIEGFHIYPRLYQKTIGSPEKGSNARCSGIVVPFLLTLDEADHRNFMTNSPDPRYRGDQNAVGFRNLHDVQSYLVAHSQEEGMLPFTEIRINLHSFHATLDHLHDVVLKRIEEVDNDNGTRTSDAVATSSFDVIFIVRAELPQLRTAAAEHKGRLAVERAEVGVLPTETQRRELAPTHAADLPPAVHGAAAAGAVRPLFVFRPRRGACKVVALGRRPDEASAGSRERNGLERRGLHGLARPPLGTQLPQR
ncbi:hypothetical protein ON010_g14339 [Phytophthora cinnamomi]|nr:hypothetical protein ON010_g14339 [Phytophthora cinnamomi]